MTIPVTVLTGFLGSGKTTLLNRLLRDPRLADALVLVNEVGAVPLDHLLVSEVREDVVVLASGCVCCSVRNDLVRALCDAYVKASRGTMKPFQRVFIETTGLADPTAVVQTLVKNGLVARGFHLDQVVVTFDAVLGLATLLRHDEAQRQLALADRIVLTKCDEILVASDLTAIEEVLHARNPLAEIQRAENGETDLAPLITSTSSDPTLSGRSSRTLGALRAKKKRLPAFSAEDDSREEAPSSEDDSKEDFFEDEASAHHDTVHGDIRTASIFLEKAVPFAILSAWVAMTTQIHGDALLRLKGIVATTEDPRPTVLQAVAHVVYPPVHLAAWPGGIVRSCIVLIARGMDAELFASLGKSLQSLGA